MLTPEQAAALALRLAEGEIAFDMMDWSGVSAQEQRDLVALACHIILDRRRGGPQRRAMGLFRSWLTPSERIELRSRRHVTVTGTAGGRYRIIPATGTTQRIELHRSRWFLKASFCLHPDQWIPPADVALAHYLSIRTDEPAFLAAANRHEHQLWDGAYLRRLNAARRRLQEEAA